MESKFFSDFDHASFWDDCNYSVENYTEAPPTDELIRSVEEELGYRLPAAYIELMRLHNGGMVTKTCCPTKESTSWSSDHVAITGIAGIGREKTYSLCGSLGSQFMIDEWGYPAIGVGICDCPSAGHDMIMLDYSKCGRDGEPEVVHVDQERDYRKTFLAKDFATFVRGLVSEDVYDTSAEDLALALAILEKGQFSDILQEFFRAEKSMSFDTVLRNLLTRLTKEKGYFALHADELSHLAYDAQFYLYSTCRGVESGKDYLEIYSSMLAMNKGGISTGGYAPGFVEDWLADRVSRNLIVPEPGGRLAFSGSYRAELLEKLQPFLQPLPHNSNS